MVNKRDIYVSQLLLERFHKETKMIFSEYQLEFSDWFKALALNYGYGTWSAYKTHLRKYLKSIGYHALSARIEGMIYSEIINRKYAIPPQSKSILSDEVCSAIEVHLKLCSNSDWDDAALLLFRATRLTGIPLNEWLIAEIYSSAELLDGKKIGYFVKIRGSRHKMRVNNSKGYFILNIDTLENDEITSIVHNYIAIQKAICISTSYTYKEYYDNCKTRFSNATRKLFSRRKKENIPTLSTGTKEFSRLIYCTSYNMIKWETAEQLKFTT